MPSDVAIILLIACFVGGYFVIGNAIERKRPGINRPSADAKQSSGKQDSPPKDRPQNTPPQWYAVLEVNEASSFEVIKKAYFQKIQSYHPDKVAGLGEEFRRLAELRSKEINAAYEIAKKLRRDHVPGGVGGR